MNKLCYRIVFNKVRGLMMVVGETARSNGKGVGEGGPGVSRLAMPALLEVTAAVALAFGAWTLVPSQAHAQVVADPNAPGRQRPTVLTTANDTIQVNIQTASGAGVSRNTYSQFDVPQGGVILNNSRVDVQTQTGGWVQGNPWLAGGSARIILNEVNSSNPSRLNGYIEVAGPRAEVIVANPAGISVNGGGFINVSRATLTTGSARMTDGRLDGFSVGRGHIGIESGGLDASTTDYAALIARSVALNGAIWARELNLVPGTGEVSADGGSTVAGAGEGPAPSYGIDVSQLGGMYANKIFLVGSEAGVGVRNAGEIGAAAGELVVTADGRIENSGRISGKQGVKLNGRGVDNSGVLSGDAGVSIQADTLRNSGTVQSAAEAKLDIAGEADNSGGTIQAQRIELTSASGAILNRGGKLQQTGGTGLDVSAPRLLNRDGGQIGTPRAAATSQTSGGTAGATPGGTQDTAQTPATGGGSVPQDSAPVLVLPNGVIRAAQAIDNTGGQITAGGEIGVQTGDFDNSGGTLTLRSWQFDGSALRNRGGTIDLAQGFKLAAPVFDNSGGKLLVGGAFDGSFGQFNNAGGLLQAQRIAVQADTNLDNTGGILRQLGDDTTGLTVGGIFTNTGGTLESGGAIALKAAQLDGGGTLNTQGDFLFESGITRALGANWQIAGAATLRAGVFTHSGLLSAGQDLLLSGASAHTSGTLYSASNLAVDVDGGLTNTGGVLGARGNVSLSAAGGLDNSGTIESGGLLAIAGPNAQVKNSGTIVSGGAARIVAAGIDNDGGQIATAPASGAALDIAAGSLSNRGGSIAGADVTRIDATAIDNNGGQIASGSRANLTLTAASLANRGGSIVADGAATIAAGAAIDNAGGAIQARDNLNLTAGTALTNDGGSIEALGTGASLSVAAGAIASEGGRIVNAGNGLTSVRADTILRNSGTISGNGNLVLGAQVLDNKADGKIGALGALDLAVTNGLTNRGAIGSNGALTLNQPAATVDNGGSIASTGALSLQAARIVNDGGRLASSADLALQTGVLSNNGGTILASGPDSRLTIDAGSIDSLAGRIENAGAGDTRVTAATSMVNSGQVAAQGALDLTAATLENRAGGTIAGAATVKLTAGQQLANAGTISSDAALDLQAAGANLRNSGRIVADGALTVAAGALDNDGGQLATAGGSDSDLTLTAASLSNRNGAIVADRDAGIAIAGALDNAQGSIKAGNALDLVAGGALDNTGGVIEAAGATTAMRVAAQSVDNSGGRIVNAGTGDTVVNGGASFLNSGEVTGAGRLLLSAQALQNRTGGTLTSGADLELAATSSFANLGGAVSSAGTLTFSGATASFANSGTMVSKGMASIVAGAIDNGGGQIVTLRDSGSAISLSGTSLRNVGGKVLADGDASVVLSGAFQNGGGTLQARGNLTVSAGGALTNDGGAIEALGAASTLALGAQSLANGTGRISNLGTGDTVVSSQTGIASNGLIAANGKLALNAATLQNAGAGAIGAGGRLDLNVSQQLDNQGKITGSGQLHFNQAGAAFNNSGQIASYGTTAIHAASVNNNGGQISTVKGAGGDIALTGALSNQGGRIAADGNAVLTSTGALDNTGGIVQAGKHLSLSATGGLSNNDGAVIETLGADSALTAQAEWIDNGGGRIANVGTGDTRLTSATSIASTGTIGGNGNLILGARDLFNGSGASISAGGNLDFAVSANLHNQGTINSAGRLTFNQAGASFYNNGRVTAGTDGVIVANGFENAGGQIGAGNDLTLSSQAFSNTGSIAADRDLRVTTNQMTGSGEFYGGRDLYLSMGGDYTQAAGIQRFRSQRDLSLAITGNFTNTATFEAVRGLDLSAASVTNAAGATIRAEDVNIHAAGGVSNAGEIQADGLLAVNAGANIDNTQGIVGGYVSLTAQNLNNTGAAALIGATGGMELDAGNAIENRGGATIYSAGYLAARAATLNNYSSTVEAGGNLAIEAGTINNVRENVVIVQNQTDETRHMTLQSWYHHGDNNNEYDPRSANYRPFETYFVNPADIIEDSTFITPDGYTIGRVVYRSHANDSAFFGAGSGAYSKYGRRERLPTVEGERTMYYLNRDNMANPDQGGAAENANPLYSESTMVWDGAPVAFSSDYGSCGVNCIRYLTVPQYDDPVNTIARTHIRELAPKWEKLEVWRDAHHTVVEDSLAPGAGAVAQIRSGGNMQLTVSQHLNNEYGDIAAAGYLGIDGAGTRTNLAATLYRRHSFDGKWQTEDGSRSTYTRPTISEIIGEVRGVIEGAQGVYITGRSFSNVDVSAGSVGIVRSNVNVLGSGTTGAASAGSGAAASGTANGAGLSGIVRNVFANAAAAAVAGAGADGVGPVTGTAGGAMANVRTAALSGMNPGTNGAAPAAQETGRQVDVMQIAPSGLFKPNPDAKAKYLLETRPQFANLQDWTSSDYLFKQLGNDPALTQKRLGDGFYEQRLVREQLAQLTGRPAQGGASDDSRYLELLSNAVSFAKAYDLRPGVALTAEQLSHLTSDIVWMESQVVSLPDGRVESALVPKVYLAHVGKDAVKPTGALVTGASVDIRTDEDIVNRGGVIDGGAGRTLLVSGRDILNQGGTIAGNDVLLAAARDVRNESLSHTQAYGDKQVQGSYTAMSNRASIAAQGALQVNAGRDFNDVAGKIDAGTASISAARDVSFGALETGSTYQQKSRGSRQNDSTVTHELSQLNTAGKLVVSAGQDVNLEGARLSVNGSATDPGAERTLVVNAGRDVNLHSTTSTTKSDNGQTNAASTVIDGMAGLYVGGAEAGGKLIVSSGRDTNLAGAAIVNASKDGITSVSAARDLDMGTVGVASRNDVVVGANNYRKENSTSEVGSQIQGAGNVTLRAGNDLSVRAGDIAAGGALSAIAGNDINLTTGVATYSLDEATQTVKRGLASKKSSTTRDTIDITQSLGSSLQGDTVNLVAGKDIKALGAAILADGNINLMAEKDITIGAATDTRSETHFAQTKKSGFSAGFSHGTASLGYNKASNTGQSASSEVLQHGTTIDSLNGNTRVQAGGNLSVIASDLSAGKDLTLIGSNVDLLAAQNTGSQNSSQQSKSSGVSVGLNLNPVSAFKTAYNQQANSGSTSFIGKSTDHGIGMAAGVKSALTPVVAQAGSRSSSTTENLATSDARVSTLAAGGKLNVLATNGSITSQGTSMRAEGDATLLAKENITLDVAHSYASQDQDSKSKGWSIDNRSLLQAGTFNGKSTGKGTTDSLTGTTLSVGGKTVLATTEGNITLTASNIASSGDVAISAAKDLTIQSGQERLANENHSKDKAVGMVKISDTERFAGYHDARFNNSESGVTQIASNVASLEGNVSLSAGGKYTQSTSNVLAKNDIGIIAKSIEVTTAANASDRTQDSSDLKIGVFARVNSPLIDLANSARAADKADGRLQDMQKLATAANAYQAANGVALKGTLVSAEAGIGIATAKSADSASSQQALTSTIKGGGNVTLTSTEGDINAVGASIGAGKSLTLDSARDIMLASAQSRARAEGSNSNAGVEVGVGYQVGAQTGAYVYASANAGKGDYQNSLTTNSNTHLTGETVNLISKGNVTLRGADVKANTINTDIGGQLRIESVQDSGTQHSEQTNVGGRVQLSFGTAWSASANASHASANGNSLTVGEQSGLFAGDGGYHVKAGSIALKGGAIASTNAANSELETSAITLEHLTNQTGYKAQSMSLSASRNGAFDTPEVPPDTPPPLEQTPMGVIEKSLARTSNGEPTSNFAPGVPMMEKGGDRSTTYATITDGKLTIGGKTMSSAAGLGAHTDAQTASRALAQLPDLKVLMQDQQAMAAAAGTVVSTSNQIAVDIAASALKEANQAAKAEKEARAVIEAANNILTNRDSTEAQLLEAQRVGEAAVTRVKEAQTVQKDAMAQAEKWSPTGDYGRALNVVTGIIVGGASGQAVGQVAAEASAPYVYEAIGDLAQRNTKPYTDAQETKLDAVIRLSSETDPATRSEIQDEIARADDALREYRDQYEAWKDGGTSKIMLHALATAALTKASGGSAVDGAIAGGLNEAKASLLSSLTKELGASSEKFVADLSSYAIGAIAGDGQTAGFALSAEVNNRQLHTREVAVIERLAKDQAKQFCKGDTRCESRVAAQWSDVLERVAEGLVDDRARVQNQEYFQKLKDSSADPNSEGARVGLESYVAMLNKAAALLAPLQGQPIVVDGKVMVSQDGAPQHYFSATAEERANWDMNSMSAQGPGPITIGRELREEDRIERFSALNGSAKKDYIVEETVLGGKIAEVFGPPVARFFGQVGNRLDISLAGTVSPSATGNISLANMTLESMELALVDSEKAMLAKLPGLTNSEGGAVRELVTDSYFTRNGFKKLEGKCGANCFDGVYVRGDKVYVVDAKPLSPSGSTSLNGPNSKTNLQLQLSDDWVEYAANRLIKSNDLQAQKTGALVIKALNDGRLVKAVAAADGNTVKLIKVK